MVQVDLTGRDDTVIKRALYYAIKYIDGLPHELRGFLECGYRAHMMEILLAMDPDYLEAQKRHLRLYTPDGLDELARRHPRTKKRVAEQKEELASEPTSLALHRHLTVPPKELKP
jgi:hypothetical protein